MTITEILEDAQPAGTSLSANLFTEIQNDILDGRLRPGDKLTEASVSERYQVSRTPVRECLARLEEIGLIELLPNRGAFVKGVPQRDAEDLFALFSAAEPLAAAWAAERITEEEMEELAEAFEYLQYYTNKNDLAKVLRISDGIHRLLYQAVHNRIFTRDMEKTLVILRHTLPYGYTRSSDFTVHLEDMRAVVRAVLRRDPVAARLSAETLVHHTAARIFGETEPDHESR